MGSDPSVFIIAFLGEWQCQTVELGTRILMYLYITITSTDRNQ